MTISLGWAPLAYSAERRAVSGSPCGRRGPGRAAAPADCPARPGLAAPAGPVRAFPAPLTPEILTETSWKMIFFVIVCHYPPDQGGNGTR
jgi:hypothetical protein